MQDEISAGDEQEFAQCKGGNNMFNLINENDQDKIDQVQNKFQSMIASKQIKGEEAMHDVDVF